MKKVILAMFLLVILLLALSTPADAQSPTPTRTPRPTVTVIYATFTPAPYPGPLTSAIQVTDFTAESGMTGLEWALIVTVLVLVVVWFIRDTKRP